MRYAQIRSMDISNGEGIGVSLFVQGCHFHCKNCFNSETWDFTGGKPWTDSIEEKFLQLIDRPYIKRISILGGEPLADENVETIYTLINKIKTMYPTKKVWLYTGYRWTELEGLKLFTAGLCDIVVDGPYIDELRDPICTCRFVSIEDAIKDMEEKKDNGEIIDFINMEARI